MCVYAPNTNKQRASIKYEYERQRRNDLSLFRLEFGVQQSIRLGLVG